VEGLGIASVANFVELDQSDGGLQMLVAKHVVEWPSDAGLDEEVGADSYARSDDHDECSEDNPQDLDAARHSRPCPDA